jgi:2,4-diketo-3-deoxy-L-fuconate hydrolase
MKLVSFIYQNERKVGVVVDESQIVDLTPELVSDTNITPDMIDLIKMGEDGAALAEKAVSTPDSSRVLSIDDITWLPPVPKPGKICGVALNNSASNSRKISAPEHPAFFLKPPSCLAAHEQSLTMRSYYGSMHPEPELALVIGRTTRDVDAVHAHKYIYGYSIFNDITGNDMRAGDLFHYQALYASKSDPDKLEKREQHLSYAGRYKGTDNFGVLGPWLVTGDEVGDPDNLAVSCTVAGEIVAEDSTRYYNYKVAEIVSFISQFHTLNTGDVISCGTAFKPSKNSKSIHQANFLVTGGPVEVSISKLGRQHNPIILEEREIGKWRLN